MYNSFFLGANSSRGFYSFYDELCDLEKMRTVYILKGGPGSGKSSIMKKIAKAATELGYDVEKIFCSSDPDSLDGIVISKLGIAMVDGTAPHVVEPKFPFAIERYIDLGRFADYDALAGISSEIVAIKKKYSQFFQHVYRLTASAAHIENELFDIALGGINIEKLHKRAAGIISREIRGKGHEFATKRRFASAISPKGYISLLNDLGSSFRNNYVIEDNFGLAHFLLTPILKTAEGSGFACTACYNPLMPERLEHILIPELSMSFVTSTREHKTDEDCHRKIRLDAMIDKDVLKQNKQRISLLSKMRDTLISDACSILREAKLVHDDMENLYNPHINFDELYSFADKLSDEIINKKN